MVDRQRHRRWSRCGTPSTSRATRPSRASWRPRRSRSQTLSLADLGIDRRRGGRGRRDQRGGRAPPAAAAPGGTEGHRRGRRRREAGRVPRRPRSSSEGEQPSMAEVLVVVEHADGAVKKVTLRAADPGPRAGRAGGGGVRWTRQRRRAAPTSSPSTARRRSTPPSSEEIDGYLVAPKADRARRAGRARSQPAAVLLASTQEGKEIAGRLAVKLDNGAAHRRASACDAGRHRRPRPSSPARRSSPPR